MPDLIPKKQFGGLFTRYPVTKNRPDNAFVASNVRIDGLGVRPFPGFTIFGNNTATANYRIRDSYTFILQDGTEIPVRVSDNTTNNIVQWYDSTNKKWYDLLAQTTGLNTSFVDFNSTDVNQLIWCNGTDNKTVWSGKTTRLTSAVTATDTDINVESTADFDATGTIVYNGIEIAYTSKTATTFVVASAHASAGADDGVAEAADDSTYAVQGRGDVMISALNRLWVRYQDKKNQIEYSDEGDALTYTGGSNRADSGVEDFPIVGGEVTGMSVKDDWMIFFKKNTIIAFTFLYPDSTTKAPNYKNIMVANNIGAINHKGIAMGYNEVLYTTKNGIRSLSKLPNSSSDFNTDPISNDIKTSIKDFDFTEASSIYYEKEDVFFVACKSDSSQDKNNRVIALWFYTDEFNERKSGFSIINMTVDSWFVYNGKLHYGSSMEGNCYEMFYGNTFAGTAIQSIYTNNRDDFGKKSIKQAEYYLVEGLIKSGTKIEYNIIYDGGQSGSQMVTIDSAGSYVSKSVINDLGAFKIGQEILGGTLTEVDGLKLFRVVIELQTKNFFDMQIQRKSTTKGGDYTIFYEAIVNAEESYEFQPDI